MRLWLSFTFPSRSETRDIFTDESLDPVTVYQAKARILNDALQEIGMGKYQWYLFLVAGFGWLSDNLWPIVTGLILMPVRNEFNVLGPWLKLAQNTGLLVRAAVWSVSSDVWARRWAFNITLGMTGIFAIAAGGSMNYVALRSLTAVWSVGVGGNLPVDSAVFLEFVPASHQYLLTVLSVWWALGQLLGSLLMMLLWVIRFFVFNLYESPKYLMGRGHDEQAVEVVHKVAAYNGKTSNLTFEDLRRAGKLADSAVDDAVHMDTSALVAVRRKMGTLSSDHVKSLFATRKMAWSATILIIIWAFIGLAFPLYNSFVTYILLGQDFGDGSTHITYRDQVIFSVIGVPRALMAGFFVELPYLGRRGTLAIFTIPTGTFILAFTTARTFNALLGWNCGYSYTSNVMYGVLYALSPELFPTKDRGIGNAIVAIANRIFGIMAPIIALYANLTTSVPIWISGAIFIVSGFIAFLLPFEPRASCQSYTTGVAASSPA
ncbi:MFS general substrate transporter [Suillus decipiens]|nr:MFS general substrate transporter [Suillus decipiens]